MRDARGRTAELVALDLGHVDCAGLFYNMDIHSYIPKRAENGDSSDDDDASEAGEGRERGHEESGSEGDGSDANGDADAGDYSYQRDGETRGGARTSTTTLRQSFDEAVASARRASSLSVQQQQPQEGQADQRRPRASASPFASASGEGVAQEDEAGEGQREGYNGGYAEWGDNPQQYTQGYDSAGNANAEEGEAADWEWSETEGWIRGRDSGSVAPAETQALDEEQQNGTAAEISHDEGYHDEGYQDEGYKGPRESDSYSGWQKPYYPTAQGDSYGGSYDGTDQEDQQQQLHSGQGGDESYDTADGVSNENIRQQDPRSADYFERASWQEPGRGDPAELLQETGVAAGAGDENRDLFEAALGGGCTLDGTEVEKVDEQVRDVGASPNHDRTSGNDGHENNGREPESATAATFHGNLNDGSGRHGWGTTVAVAQAGNRWMSLLDRTSGTVYYQNEQSGQTEWDVPEGAVVVSSTPEDV